jgi:hypothetical protein
MVRRGSTVRVRQRASLFNLLAADCFSRSRITRVLLPGDRLLQPEVGQRARGGEARDVRNMLSVERQHQQRNGAADLGVGILDVVPEGKLGVRAGRDQPARVVPPRGEGVADESSDVVAALVPERLTKRSPRSTSRTYTARPPGGGPSASPAASWRSRTWETLRSPDSDPRRIRPGSPGRAGTLGRMALTPTPGASPKAAEAARAGPPLPPSG